MNHVAANISRRCPSAVRGAKQRGLTSAATDGRGGSWRAATERGFVRARALGAVWRVLAITGAIVAWAMGLQAAEPVVPAGWRLGPAAWSFKAFTLYDAIDRTAALGLHYLEAFDGQALRAGTALKFTPGLPEDAVTELRAKLRSASVGLTSYYLHELPGEETACRRAFELARALGVEAIISEPAPASLNLIERLCDEYGVKVALHNHPRGSSRYWDPQEVLRVLDGRSPRLGACADVGHWQRCGINPVDGVRLLGRRLLSLHVKDLNERSPSGHDVWWGTGQGDIGGLLRQVHELGVTPTLFTIEYEFNWEDNRNDIAECATFFYRTAEGLATVEKQQPPLWAGWASVDITPPKPVALIGQLHKRISTGVRDPLTATALALETQGPGGEREQAVLVSCDLLFIQGPVQQRLRERLKASVPDLEVQKVVLNATHTHTGPGFIDGTFGDLDDVRNDPGVMTAGEYAEFFLGRVSEVVAKAWQNREPAGLSWALTQAVIGSNRRVQSMDGSSVMYGDTRQAGFSNMEGGEDHALRLLFLWTPAGQLSGVVMNVACTAQETEQLLEVSADFWHDTRLALRARLGAGLFVLPQCAPAGDFSPHLVYRQAAAQRMDERRGVSRRGEIARRLANAVDDALPTAKPAQQKRLVFRHVVAHVDLPEHEPPAPPFYKTDPVHPVEVHVLRLGEVAMATSPFELFSDYGVRVEARSGAILTFQVQLSGATCGYLPTARAVKGGGYSADKFIVGPVGGQALVEETVRRIQGLWP